MVIRELERHILWDYWIKWVMRVKGLYLILFAISSRWKERNAMTHIISLFLFVRFIWIKSMIFSISKSKQSYQYDNKAYLLPNIENQAAISLKRDNNRSQQHLASLPDNKHRPLKKTGGLAENESEIISRSWINNR
jgi:hypothetical protein